MKVLKNFNKSFRKLYSKYEFTRAIKANFWLMRGLV